MSDDALQKTAGPGGLMPAPAFIEDSNDGLQEIGFKDIVLPRLSLCQKTSPQRDKLNTGKFIKGLEEGQFFSSLTGKIYGEKIQVIPLFFYHSRIMFKDINEGGGIVCQAPDGVRCQMNNGGPCLHSAWGPKGEPPECSEFFNYPCFIWTGDPATSRELIIVSMKTTGLKAGRTLNSLMRLRQKPAYAGIYELSGVGATNKANQSYYTWQAVNATPQPWVDDKDLYEYAKTQSKIVQEGLKSGRIQVDESDIDQFAARDSEV
jgi:hypothetical protein